jgi:hypothetical protein
MFKRLIKWLTSQQTDLEKYILSKNPTNAAEVDYWTTRYGQESQRGW